MRMRSTVPGWASHTGRRSLARAAAALLPACIVLACGLLCPAGTSAEPPEKSLLDRCPEVASEEAKAALEGLARHERRHLGLRLKNCRHQMELLRLVLQLPTELADPKALLQEMVQNASLSGVLVDADLERVDTAEITPLSPTPSFIPPFRTVQWDVTVTSGQFEPLIRLLEMIESQAPTLWVTALTIETTWSSEGPAIKARLMVTTGQRYAEAAQDFPVRMAKRLAAVLQIQDGDVRMDLINEMFPYLEAPVDPKQHFTALDAWWMAMDLLAKAEKPGASAPSWLQFGYFGSDLFAADGFDASLNVSPHSQSLETALNELLQQDLCLTRATLEDPSPGRVAVELQMEDGRLEAPCPKGKLNPGAGKATTLGQARISAQRRQELLTGLLADVMKSSEALRSSAEASPAHSEDPDALFELGLQPLPSADPPPCDTWIKASGENQYLVDRTQLNKRLADLSRLGREARIIPYYDAQSGTYRGFKLIGLKPSSIYSALGIRSGDILTTVQGVFLDSPRTALEVFDKLQSAPEVTLVLLRKGESITIRIKIEEGVFKKP